MHGRQPCPEDETIGCRPSVGGTLPSHARGQVTDGKTFAVSMGSKVVNSRKPPVVSKGPLPAPVISGRASATWIPAIAPARAVRDGATPTGWEARLIRNLASDETGLGR